MSHETTLILLDWCSFQCCAGKRLSREINGSGWGGGVNTDEHLVPRNLGQKSIFQREMGTAAPQEAGLSGQDGFVKDKGDTTLIPGTQSSTSRTTLKVPREVTEPLHGQKSSTTAPRHGEQPRSQERDAILQVTQEQKGMAFQSG